MRIKGIESMVSKTQLHVRDNVSCYYTKINLDVALMPLYYSTAILNKVIYTA